MSELRVQAEILKAFAQDIMRAFGVDEEQVQSVSENLIWSDLVGRSNFGVQRLPIHMKRVERGVLSCPCRLEFRKLSDCVELLDGGGGFGHHVGWRGMARAIELAKAHGVGVIGVRNSNFFGAGAYFVHQAAQAGMISLALSNSFPKVAAHGGIAPVLGTNPFAFGAPRRDGQSLLLDMATSALAGSTIRQHILTGAPLPAGLAMDDSGRPITDPTKVADGALLPFGGTKGYGLGLLVEILSGVITGAGVSHGVASMYSNFKETGNSGHFLMALDVSRWMPMETYYKRLETLIEVLKGSGPEGQVQFPGENRWRHFHENTSSGIPLESDTRKALRGLCEPRGIKLPWTEN